MIRFEFWLRLADSVSMGHANEIFTLVNIEAKTIANVRTIGFSDRKIPKVSTIKGLRLTPAFENRFGFKTCKELETFLFFAIKKRKVSITSKEKKHAPNGALFSHFSPFNFEMS